MSHSVTITRTVTSSTGTGTIIYNTGYLKTVPGLLKLLQLLLGAACVGVAAYYYRQGYHLQGNPVLFFLLMVTAFMIGTFCLLLSCIVSLSTGGIISKTIYELVYHSIACILLLAASLTLLIENTNYRRTYAYEAYMAASIMGLINTILYAISAILAQRSYRGI